jgi:dolichol-phosphate mannosyltransferase
MHNTPLSIIIPFYNEESYLPTVIQNIIHIFGNSAELILINDGSTDGSLKAIEPLLRRGDVLLQQDNLGKGAAVQAGITHATKEYTIIQDADLEYNPEDIQKMLELAINNNYDAVTGSRRLKKQKQYAHIAYYFGGVFITTIFNVLFKTKLTDQPCCYKLVRTSVLQSLPLQEKDFRFDIELSALLAKRGITMHEVSVSYSPRTRLEGKKIGFPDFYKAVFAMIKLYFKK